MVTLSAPRASNSSGKTLFRIYYVCGFGSPFAMLPMKNLSLATHTNISHSSFYWILVTMGVISGGLSLQQLEERFGFPA